jgi:transcriptional regulator with XRE-family HTH domain
MSNRRRGSSSRRRTNRAGQPSGYGLLVVQERGRRRMTQAELAHRVGCDGQTISNLERGHTARPRNSVTEGLARAFGMSTQKFHREAERLARLAASPRTKNPPASPWAGCIFRCHP